MENFVCPHFGTCGGCSLLSISSEGILAYPYEEELRLKEEKVRGLLSSFDIPNWRPIIGSPDVWYYRNKMEYAFGETEVWQRKSGSGDRGVGGPEKEQSSEPPTLPPSDPALLGLRQAGRFNTIVDLKACYLMSPEAEKLIALAREWAHECGYSGYNRRAFKGDLRYLVLREAKNTGERMGILIASSHLKSLLDGDRAKLDALTNRVQPFFSTFYLAFTDKTGDVARTDDMHLLWGSGVMQERLNGLMYRISPYSFFQTNTHGTERLHGVLSEWAKTLGGGALIDLYCGSGAIGLSLAKGFDRVVGIDTNTEAIQDAQHNATTNGITHTEFVSEDAQEFLKKLPGSKLSVQMSALVIDPPRPGLHPKALKSLLEINPPKMAYVSCNPESLARDLQSLIPFYTIASAQPIDLFPHTAHVETVVTLEHR